MRGLIVAALSAIVLAACGGAGEGVDAPAAAAMVEEDGVRFENATFRPPFGGRDVAAAYVSITATGDQPVTILGAASDIAGNVELHTVSEVDGKMAMRRVERYEVGAGDTLALRTGAEHLMLFGVDGSFAGGDKVTITLTYTLGNSAPREVEVDFTVDALD